MCYIQREYVVNTNEKIRNYFIISKRGKLNSHECNPFEVCVSKSKKETEVFHFLSTEIHGLNTQGHCFPKQICFD